MEKAIEIKRRAQRCIINGDLDGALAEYEKLAALENSDPYNYVLLADLTFKRGDHDRAAERYLQAADSYEKAGLYKNAIAVCKKMIRLKLSPPGVLKRLASLHALDGLATEAALYWMQYAEYLTQEQRYKEAAESLRQAFDTCPENVRSLEKLAEVKILDGDNPGAARALAEAASHYKRGGSPRDADRCRQRAEQLQRGAVSDFEEETRRGDTTGRPVGAAAEAAPRVVDGADGPSGSDGVIERMAITDFRAGSTPLPGLERLPVEPLAGRREPLPGLDSGAVAPEEPQPPAAGAPEEPKSPAASAPVEPAALPVREVAPAAAADAVNGVADVEALLRQAEQEFRGGDRDAASRTLMRAAQSYEEFDKLESAAVIYRSLSKSPNAPGDAALRWFQNCERRGQKSEAAQVACEIGDRVLSDGDTASAVQWFERARGLDPANDHALRRLSRLDVAAEPAAAAAAPAPPPAPLPISPPAAALPAAPAPGLLPPVAPAPPGQGKLEVAMGSIDAVAPDLSALLGEFQRGVEALISDDAQSNYDLGMAYREMGLLDQAVECFRIAARSPAFVQRCSEMIGRSLLDQGLFDDAIAEFTSALTIPGLDPASAANVRFQLGLAHEAAGRSEEALSEFEQVYAQQANYPDVAQKIKALRRALESV